MTLSEQSFGISNASGNHELKNREISQKLCDVEILYILASNPKTLETLVGRLKTIFGLETVTKVVLDRLTELMSHKLVISFSSRLEGQKVDGNYSHESFSLTPLGLNALSEWIEALSEITLTMQLGLDQRIMVAEE
jgi:hypothetical protein